MLLTLIKGNADLFDPEIGNIGLTHDMQNDSAANKTHHGSAKCGHCRVLRATQFHIVTQGMGAIGILVNGRYYQKE